MSSEQAVGTIDRPELVRGASDALWGPRVRLVLAAAYAAVFVQQAVTVGIPFDNRRLLAWIAGALAISCVGRPLRAALLLVRDWVPFALLLLVYAYSRGAADRLGSPVQVGSVVAVEKALFLGEVPSVWLQRRLLPDGARTPVGLWEVAVLVVYVSHFVAPYVLAAYLWVRDRPAWAVYVQRFAILCVLAVVTFALLPAAPPWMAADQGLMGEVVRPVGRGWQRLSLHSAGSWLDAGRAWANPVAAIPSLHTAFAALVAVTLYARSRSRPLRALVVAYPVAMAFVLVYGAEHYVVDVVAGVAYLGLAVLLQRRLSTWWQRRRPTELHPSCPPEASS